MTFEKLAERLEEKGFSTTNLNVSISCLQDSSTDTILGSNARFRGFIDGMYTCQIITEEERFELMEEIGELFNNRLKELYK